MSSNDFNSIVFLRRLRRRLILATLVNRLGFVILVISLAATALELVGMWVPATAALVFNAISIVAIFSVLILAIRRWPTLAAAGALADRQLHLDDLLTTTLNLRPVPFDDLSSTVIAIADARCRQLSPSEVAILRLSGKSWSGIALAAGLAVALMVVPMRSESSQRAVADANVLASAVDIDPAIQSTHAPSGSRTSRDDPIGEGESQISSSTDAESPTDAATASNTHAPPPGSGDSSVGAGAASTNKPITAPTPDRAAAGGHSPEAGGSTSGAGRVSTERRTGTDAVTGTTAGGSPTADIPAWQSTNWPAARAAALPPAGASTIPPAYRDLIRDYFQQ